MSGTIFSVRSKSAISAFFIALRISAWPAARKRWRKGFKNRKEKKGLWQSQSRRWTWPHLSVEILRLCRVRLRKKARDTWSKRLQSRRSVEFSSVATRCGSGWKYEETRSDRKSGHQRQRQHLATQSPDIYRLRTAHGEGFLNCETKIWSQSERQNEKLSIWTQLYGLYSCPSLFKLQVILVQTTRRSCVLPGISPRNLSDSCFKWLKSWSLTKLKLLVLLRLIGSNSFEERETTLLTDKAVQCATAETCVFSDSVLCLGRISPEPVKAWERKIKCFVESRSFRVLDRIDGEPMEFEWKNFSGFTTLGVLDEIQKMMTELKCEPEHFQGRIIFIVNVQWHWSGKTRKQRKLYCECSQSYWICTKIHLRKWYGTHVCNPDGQWDEVAENMMINFAESGNPIFRASSALERGELKSKEKGMITIHYNGTDETIELILRTVISVNQLSVYGVATDLCGELATDSKGTGGPGALRISNLWSYRQNFHQLIKFLRLIEVQGNLLCEHDQKFADLPEQ